MCPDGRYNNDTGQSECQICEAGRDCISHNNSEPCPRGQFSLEGQGGCDMCPQGTFSEAGVSSCQPCPPGHFCYDPSLQPQECPIGYTSDDGATNCTICPIGMYVRLCVCPIGMFVCLFYWCGIRVFVLVCDC